MKKKKLKWAIPAAVVALSCGTMVALTGCGNNDEDPVDPNPPAHTHQYTEWGHDEDQHWKLCPDDQTIDETTRADHDYDADGNCECGDTTEVAVYGTVKGEVKLNKKGEAITDFTGLKVDIDDDEATVKTSTADGKFTYTITDVTVGKSHTLTITKSGYSSYSTVVELEKENEEAVIGGADGITLDYEMFGMMIGWNENHHDFSHTNDADPYILFGDNNGNESLNVMSKDSFTGAAATASMKIKLNNSAYSQHTQGMVLKFADGKHMVIRFNNGDNAPGKIQYANRLWENQANGFKQADTLFGEVAQNQNNESGDGEWGWGEHNIYILTDDEWGKIRSQGADLTCILKDGSLYTFFDGKFVEKFELPAGYSDKNVQVGYFSYNPVGGAKFYYNMDGVAPEIKGSKVNLPVVEQPDFAGDAGKQCLVDLTALEADETHYAFGTDVTATITTGTERKLESFTIDGVDYFEDALDGSVTFKASRLEHNIQATFIAQENASAVLTVKGRADGVIAPLATASVSFSGTAAGTTDAEGKVTANVAKGRYIVSATGYLPKEINWNGEAQEITLERQTLISNAGDEAGVDLSQMNMNAETNRVTAVGNSKEINVYSAETYTTATATAKFDIIDDYANKQRRYGIYLRFNDGKNLRVDLDLHEGDVNRYKTPYILQETAYGAGSMQDGFNAWNDVKKYSEEDVAGFVANGFTYTLVRDSAKVHVIINGEHIKTYTLPDGYKEQAAQIGFIMNGTTTDGTKGFTYSIANEVKAVNAITATTPGNGTVTLDKASDGYKLGDTVTVTLAPATDYKIGTLTVGGKDVTTSISGGVYTFTAGGDTAVVATFEPIANKSINAEIVGKKLGTTNGLTGTEAVTLTSCQLVAPITTAKIFTEGGIKLVGQNIPKGVYTLNVAGYLPTTITVGDADYTDRIDLEYDLMENLTNKWGWGDKADLTEQNDGKLTQVQGETQWVSSKDLYDNVAITATVVSGGNRQGVFIRFSDDDNAYNDDQYVMIQKENNDKITWNGIGDLWGNGGNLIKDVWTDYENPLMASPDSYTLTLVREGVNIHVFINGKFYETKTLGNDYASKQCYVGLYCIVTPANSQRTFKIEEATKYTNFTITNGTEATGAGGSISFDKGNTEYKLGETVNVTINAESGKKLKKLEVGGVDVTSKVVGGASYSFRAGGDTTVKATFEDIVPSSINNATVVGNNITFAGTETVTLKSNTVADISGTLTKTGETVTLSVADVPAGDYLVCIDGCLPTAITVGSDAYSGTITMQGASFTQHQGWGTMDVNKLSEGKFIHSNGSELFYTNETYDNVAFSVLLGPKQINKSGNQGIVFKFGNEVAVIRMENTTKIQVEQDEWLVTNAGKGSMAVGSSWHDLIFFRNTNDGTADANAAKYLEEFNNGTLKLTCVRKGATVYVFLDGTYIGKHDFDAKYESVKASAGIYIGGYDDNINKEWNMSLETDISAYEALIAAAETPTPEA